MVPVVDLSTDSAKKKNCEHCNTGETLLSTPFLLCGPVCISSYYSSVAMVMRSSPDRAKRGLKTLFYNVSCVGSKEACLGEDNLAKSLPSDSVFSQ